jgi:small-conductance mechanosensitive channel
VITLAVGHRSLRIAALLALLLHAATPARAGQDPAASPASAATAADPEAETASTPVLLGGDPIIWITVGAGPYSPHFRAQRISERLESVARDRSISDPTVTVTENEGSSELRAGSRLLMVVTQQDARSLGTARASLAAQYARELETAIRSDRLRYAPAALVRSGVYGVVATLTLALAIWIVGRVTRRLRRWIQGRWRQGGALRVQQAEIVSADRIGHTVDVIIRAVRVLVILLFVDLYLTYTLGLFPWTRAVSRALVGYVVSPFRAAGVAFLGYLPKLLFVLVIAGIIHVAIRLVSLFFNQVKHERIVFANFPAEWADPTNKIVRILLIAFGLVVAFPYLPASDSPAFAGVSVFMGVLFSLASSSALSNMIAGFVLTYTGAFRLGDRVKVGDSFGDIIETSLLATRVRTIKNEDITIPNSLVLGTSILNYTRESKTLGLILHTSVTIGYDAPWRQIHDLLIAAALETPGILKEPRPFVWQTALNDFYVTYEINAYTKSPRDMIDIYAALHARIQDEFYAAGVEIMSPHFTAIRDGNSIAIPDAFRGAEYRAPAFRVQDMSAPNRATGVTGTAPSGGIS